MTQAHARALLPASAVEVLPFTPERDALALRSLAEWATRFSPSVATDPPDGLLMDLTGCERVFGGEERLVGLIANSVNRLHLDCRVAAAPTFGGAWAAARFGPHSRQIISGDDWRNAFHGFPVAALRVEASVVTAMAEVGVQTVGELVKLSRAQLVARFGAGLLLRLDQLYGEAVETIEPVRPIPPPSCERVFDGPTAQVEGLAVAARELLVELSRELERHGRGALRLELQLDRSDLQPTTIDVVMSRPSRSPKHLWTMLRPQLERAHLGFGVERLQLTALRTGVMRHRQEQAWEDASAPVNDGHDAALGEFIDQLVNRFGVDHVTRVRPVASYLPERSFIHLPILANGVTPRALDRDAGRQIDAPSVLLAFPEPVQVVAMTPDGPVAMLRWRAERHDIVTSHGPERVALEWWPIGAPPRSVCRGRDYFSVQTQTGRWLWIYREVGTSRWFLHGHWS